MSSTIWNVSVVPPPPSPPKKWAGLLLLYAYYAWSLLSLKWWASYSESDHPLGRGKRCSSESCKCETNHSIYLCFPWKANQHKWLLFIKDNSHLQLSPHFFHSCTQNRHSPPLPDNYFLGMYPNCFFLNDIWKRFKTSSNAIDLLKLFYGYCLRIWLLCHGFFFVVFTIILTFSEANLYLANSFWVIT